jgi:GNAT superfamily N-acetyltransferase
VIRLRPMTAADIPLGMRLKEQNGWNQLEADWQRVLYLQPDGCFVAEWNGTPVGTTVVTIFGDVAWIAMVLVDANHRGHGIGTALMKHALDFLDARGVPSVRLDATPLGRPIYEKLGFVAEYELARYEGVLEHCKPPGKHAQVALEPLPEGVRGAAVLREVLHFDYIMTGARRGLFLSRLFAEYPEYVRVARHGDVAGYFAARPGSHALLLGPCVADGCAGGTLEWDAAARLGGQRVFMDIPLAETYAIDRAEMRGLKVQRRLLRMCRGKPVRERVGCLWASSGPEKG